MDINKNRKSELPVPFSFSQSSLQDYSKCERRFYLRYIEQLSWPSIESEPVLENERRQMEGQIFHRIVQQFWLGLPIDKLTRSANSTTLGHWWENFLGYDFHLKDFSVFPELSLSSQIGKHRLIAKYDLVAICNDKILIFDWKTYTKRPREEWMAITYQTRVYRSLMVQAGGFLLDMEPVNPEKVEMIYWLANFPNQPINFLYNSSQSVRDRKHLETLISRIDAQEDFPMTEDINNCKYCTYRSYCDRGTSAATYDEDFEPQLEMSDLTMDQISEIEI